MMDRRAWMIGAGGVAAGVAGLGAAWWRASRQPDSEAVWRLQFDRPEGGALALAALRGRPLLLNFWATWCPPCVKEMPLLDAFQHEQADRHWQVVGLAVDSLEPVRTFLSRRPVGYSIGLAGLAGVELSRQLGNDSGALPFSVVFDSSGHVAARKLGLIHPDTLQGWLRDVS